MINRITVKTLRLKPITRTIYSDFYKEINTEFGTPEAIKESVSWWRHDSKKLNDFWWVLNYYSDRLDSDRHLRPLLREALICSLKKARSRLFNHRNNVLHGALYLSSSLLDLQISTIFVFPG
jgi:hypothetical protein